VARNRKRAKERRARRPQPVASRTRERATGAPSPLEHAAPDAEIAEQAELPPDLRGSDSELEELGGEVQDDDYGPHSFGGGRIPGVTSESITEVEADGDDDQASEPEAGAVAVPATAVGQPRAVPGNRLINFLRGSWAELQRVQWPDRQQVFQATGVVIGFVIVAGVFLGVSDWLAGHLVSFIETGHF
jgi:preprotein translocase subunit SecE